MYMNVDYHYFIKMKAFLLSYLHQIPNPNNELNNVKGTQDKHIPIFSQQNSIYGWLSIVFHTNFEEVHNADNYSRILWHTYQHFSIP